MYKNPWTGPLINKPAWVHFRLIYIHKAFCIGLTTAAEKAGETLNNKQNKTSAECNLRKDDSRYIIDVHWNLASLSFPQHVPANLSQGKPWNEGFLTTEMLEDF